MAGPWPLDRLAVAAGETEDRLRWYAEAGLLHRQANGEFDPDSLHRLRLIQFVRSRGVSDEKLAAENQRQGDLLGLFDRSEPAGDSAANLVVAARQLDLDEAVITELGQILDWDGAGFATESDLAIVGVTAKALALGMPADALMQLLRVFADTIDRLADAEVRMFHHYVHERFRAQGLAGRRLLEATQQIATPLLDLAEPAVVSFHRRAYQRASREDLLRHLAEDTNPPAPTPGEEQATVLFVDLASFTPLTATMGDDTAVDILRRFGVTVRGNATRYQGRIVKQIGDAFMLMFAQPAQAVEFGCAMERFVDTETQFPALHIGAHHGTVLYHEGDYVGATVNLAARVASAGAAGQFLITEDLRHAAGPVADADYISLPPQRLKGIPEPLCLLEVRRRGPDRVDRETDPVCGMLLHPADVEAHTTWRGTSYAFCSDKCRRAFIDNPAHFAAAAQDWAHE
ncbi:MAG TPA: adenylate/guanylate cyclase domain-containing protein [Mycobacterium sp.]|nr:adenylate/guanylate cyclase domain-containing protein [Mycobacterium sp.]